MILPTELSMLRERERERERGREGERGSNRVAGAAKMLHVHV